MRAVVEGAILGVGLARVLLWLFAALFARFGVYPNSAFLSCIGTVVPGVVRALVVRGHPGDLPANQALGRRYRRKITPGAAH